VVGNLTLLADWLRANACRFGRRFGSTFPNGGGDPLLVLLAVLKRHEVTCSQISAALSFGVECHRKLLSLAVNHLVDHHRVTVNRSNGALGGMRCRFRRLLGSQSGQSESNYNNSI